MGMFDYLKCEYALPDSAVQNETFQTKSLDKVLGDYTITADGLLILRGVRSVPTGDVEIAHHGDIRFYTSIGSRENGDYERFEYQARFTDGKLQWLKRIEQK